MKFEINPNELTAEQRNHVSDFIRNWPTYDLHIPRNAHSIKEDAQGVRATIPNDEQLTPVPIEACRQTVLITEEQRLDAEQKADLTQQALGSVDTDNLAAIFGSPNAPKGLLDDTVPLDKEGLPWDSRIHSSSKAFIADGTWKLRRGVDPAEVAKVKVQLRELMAVPQVTAAPISVPVPPAPKSHYLIDQQPELYKSIDQQPTVTLTDLISRISKAIAEGRITQATVTEVCLKHRVSEFALLSNRPDLLPLIDADMKALGV